MTKDFIKELMSLDAKQLASIYTSLYLQASKKGKKREQIKVIR